MSLAASHGPGEFRPSCRVVVLCTKPRLRQLLGYWLAPTTRELTVVTSGRQAAALLSDHGRSTVLITDRIVPPWPGLPTLAALKQANPLLRVVLVDGPPGATGQGPRAHAGGADDALPRPLSRAAVLRSISPC